MSLFIFQIESIDNEEATNIRKEFQQKMNPALFLSTSAAGVTRRARNYRVSCCSSAYQWVGTYNNKNKFEK